MKIATFNVNNVNKRLANLVGWLGTARPDVACLQELKATDSEVPLAAIKRAGYGGIWRGERSWNGVAILSRGIEPIVTNNTLPGDPSDAQGRYIEAAVGGVLIASLYAPNGNPQPGPKFTYKLAWLERLVAHAAVLYELNAPVVLAGDLTWCLPHPTFTPLGPTTRMPSCSPSPVPWVGLTPSVRCILMHRCTRSGTTSETVGRAMLAFGLIICF